MITPKTIEDLPNELRSRIVRELDLASARALLLVSKGWTGIAESRIWRDVLVAPSSHLPHPDTPPSPATGWRGRLRRTSARPRSLDPTMRVALQIVAYDGKWARLLEALKCDPRRAAYVHSIRFNAACNNDRALLDVFKMVCPTLRSLQAELSMCGGQHDYVPDPSHPANIMPQVGPFPALTKVVISIGNDDAWMENMWAVLASTPSLEWFESMGPDYVGDDIGEDRPPGYQETPSMDLVDASLKVDLPYLYLLKLGGVQSINLAANIFRVAPQIRRLEIRLESHAFSRITKEDLDVFTRKKSITNAIIKGRRTSGELNRYLRAEGSRKLWPNMMTYTSADTWDESAFGHHSKLHARRLLLFQDEGRHLNKYPFTRPSTQVTGFVAPWLARALNDNPSLEQMRPYILESEVDDLNMLWHHQPGGFRIRSFSNGIDTLYHIRWHWNDVFLFFLAPHAISYTPDPWPWTSVYDLADADQNLQGDGHQDRDMCEDLPQDWIDFTSYDGVPLPTALLDWTYKVSGLPTQDWDDGGRCLPLVDGAWEVLNAWREEVRLAEGI